MTANPGGGWQWSSHLSRHFSAFTAMALFPFMEDRAPAFLGNNSLALHLMLLLRQLLPRL